MTPFYRWENRGSEIFYKGDLLQERMMTRKRKVGTLRPSALSTGIIQG